MNAMARYVPRNNILIFPAYLMAQPTDGAVLPPRFKSQDSQRLWDYHALLLIIWAWDTLKDL